MTNEEFILELVRRCGIYSQAHPTCPLRNNPFWTVLEYLDPIEKMTDDE